MRIKKFITITGCIDRYMAQNLDRYIQEYGYLYEETPVVIEGIASLKDILPPFEIPKKYIKWKEQEQDSFTYHLKMYEDEKFFQEIVDLKEEWKAEPKSQIIRFINIWDYAVEYTKEELEKAVGYVFGNEALAQDDVCSTSDDVENKEWCEECGQYGKQLSPYVLKRSKKLSGWNERRKVFYTDDMETVLVSVPMYEYLLENGISEDYFIPAYNGVRKKTLAGYQVVSPNQLPCGAYIAPSIKYTETCPVCGRNRSKIVIEGKEAEYFHNQYLDTSMVPELQDISASFESHGENPALIVNKRTHDLLVEADPTLKMIPIFPKGAIKSWLGER